MEEKKETKDLDILLIVSILKGYTSPEQAISTTIIAREMLLCGYKEISPRTISRKMDSIMKEQMDELSGPLLRVMFGGEICVTSALGILSGAYRPKENSTREQKYYYFVPNLTDSQIDMLRAMINSHPYFAASERLGLLEGLGISQREDYESVSKRLPIAEGTIPLPGNYANILRNIEVLHTAIAEKLQVQFTYGTYDVLSPEKERKVVYRQRTNEDGSVKEYVVNPFGLLWDDGYYYLVASVANRDSQPTHYRVDRIIRAGYVMKSNKNGDMQAVSREKIPESLSVYMKKGSLDEKAYRRNHKGMRIYEQSNMIDFSVECSDWSLQMLVDSFGEDVLVKDCQEEIQKSELGTYRKNEKKLQARVKGVEYQTALTFCLAHADYITVLEPKELKDGVKQWLRDCLNRLG